MWWFRQLRLRFQFFASAIQFHLIAEELPFEVQGDLKAKVRDTVKYHANTRILTVGLALVCVRGKRRLPAPSPNMIEQIVLESTWDLSNFGICKVCNQTQNFPLIFKVKIRSFLATKSLYYIISKYIF